MSSANDATERRRFTRIPFMARVILSNNRGIWHGDLVDISLRGLLMSRPANWDDTIDDECRVEISLERGGPSIQVNGRVAHIDEQLFGLCFQQMDVRSAARLRKLIALNLGDEQLLERELAELIKAHLTT